jgi:amino acid transporter
LEQTPPAGQSPAAAPRYHTDEDEKELHRLGYAQELFRAMGGFQNFAISFTIISILAGCLTSYSIAYGQGGPVSITWGWLIVGTMSTLVALAMAEIASSYPTAGGLYYWASKLGSPGWGWFTGWFNLVGQIAVTAAIGYGLAIFSTALLNYWFDYPNTKGYVYLTYAVVLTAALILNLFRITVTAMLNTISAYWHMIGVGVIVLVLALVPDDHRSFSFVFTETLNLTGWGGDPGPTSFSSPVFWYVFLTGFLMAQYTITGFDASAHVAEETHKASRSAAVGMYMSVVASVIFGFILLVAVTAALPAEPVFDLYIVPSSWVTAMGESWGTSILFICCVAQLFCLIASVTSASRMLFAFSRDRAVPGHQLWRRVSSNRVPHMAVIAIVVAAAALMLPTLYNFFIGYYVGTGIAVIGLYIAFILPVILRYRMKDEFQPGAWTLGKHYRWIDPIAIVWVFFISIVFLMPPYSISAPWKDGFTWEAVNYAPILVGGAILLFGGWWVLSAKNWFKGPVRMGTDEELERIEEQYERPAGTPSPAAGS